MVMIIWWKATNVESLLGVDDVRLATLATAPTALCVGSCARCKQNSIYENSRRTYRVYTQHRAPCPHIIGAAGYPTWRSAFNFLWAMMMMTSILRVYPTLVLSWNTQTLKAFSLLKIEILFEFFTSLSWFTEVAVEHVESSLSGLDSASPSIRFSITVSWLQFSIVAWYGLLDVASAFKSTFTDSLLHKSSLSSLSLSRWYISINDCSFSSMESTWRSMLTIFEARLVFESYTSFPFEPWAPKIWSSLVWIPFT